MKRLALVSLGVLSLSVLFVLTPSASLVGGAGRLHVYKLMLEGTLPQLKGAEDVYATASQLVLEQLQGW